MNPMNEVIESCVICNNHEIVVNTYILKTVGSNLYGSIGVLGSICLKY